MGWLRGVAARHHKALTLTAPEWQPGSGVFEDQPEAIGRLRTAGLDFIFTEVKIGRIELLKPGNTAPVDQGSQIAVNITLPQSVSVGLDNEMLRREVDHVGVFDFQTIGVRRPGMMETTADVVWQPVNQNALRTNL